MRVRTEDEKEREGNEEIKLAARRKEGKKDGHVGRRKDMIKNATQDRKAGSRYVKKLNERRKWKTGQREK